MNAKPVIRTVILLVIIVALGWALYTNFIKDKQSHIQVGQKAPDFMAQDLSGKEVRLSELKGKGVILNFWGTWCAPCRQEMPALEEMSKELADQNIVILAINNGESDVVVKSFAENYKLTFPILLDRRLDISKAYQANNLPTSVFIKPDGTIAWIVTGPMTADIIRENAKKMTP